MSKPSGNPSPGGRGQAVRQDTSRAPSGNPSRMRVSRPANPRDSAHLRAPCAGAQGHPAQATQTTPNAPAIRHASASLRPHTAHPATRRMQILVDRDEPVPLRRAHAPRATLDGRHCRPAMRRPGEARGAQTFQRIHETRQEKMMVLPPDHLSPKERPRCPVIYICILRPIIYQITKGISLKVVFTRGLY